MSRPGTGGSLAVVVCCAVVLAACGGISTPSAVTHPDDQRLDFGEGEVRAEATTMSSDSLILDDVAMTDSGIVALASTTTDGDGGVLLRSSDGGRSWEQSPTPLAGAISGEQSRWWEIGPSQPEVHAAGKWLVVTRTVSDEEVAFDPRLRQAVAVSDDVGKSWVVVDLPTPEGMNAIVSAAIAVDGRLILGGSTQTSTVHAVGRSEDKFAERQDAYDAALWQTTEPREGFDRLASGDFDGADGAQIIRQLVKMDGRVIALGGDSAALETQQCCFLDTAAVAWSNADGASGWSLMAGLPPHPQVNGGSRSPAVMTDDGLLRPLFDYQMLLEPGSDTWRDATVHALPTQLFGKTPTSDGAAAVTWVEASACDCSVAHAGRLEGNELGSTKALTFEACDDKSVRGETAVFDPVSVGGAAVALAWCNDDGLRVAFVAMTTDGGRTWTTHRLSGLAGGSNDLLVPTTDHTPMVRIGDTTVMVLSSRTARSAPSGEAASGSTLRAIRLSPA